MLAFPSVRPSVRLPSVCSIEISASRPARDFKFFLFDSSRGLDLPICKFFWWAHRGAVGGPKRGFFHTKFKVWLAICQNITKFDGEHDGAHPRNNWTNFFFNFFFWDLIKGLRGNTHVVGFIHFFRLQSVYSSIFKRLKTVAYYLKKLSK